MNRGQYNSPQLLFHQLDASNQAGQKELAAKYEQQIQGLQGTLKSLNDQITHLRNNPPVVHVTKRLCVIS